MSTETEPRHKGRVETAQIEVEAERARRYEAQMAIILVDLDGLSVLNQSMGQEAGDELLRQVASTIRANLRKIDVFGRWYPEDFAILTVDKNPFGAMVVAEKLRQLVEQSTFRCLGKPVTATVSIGLACGKPRSAEDVDQLIESARRGLMHAKSSGRNRVIFESKGELSART